MNKLRAGGKSARKLEMPNVGVVGALLGRWWWSWGADRFAVWPVDLGGELAAAASLCSGMYLRALHVETPTTWRAFYFSVPG